MLLVFNLLFPALWVAFACFGMPHTHSATKREERLQRDIRTGFREASGRPTAKCFAGGTRSPCQRETDHRLRLIEPVVARQVEGVNVSGAARLLRNVASRKFSAPISALTKTTLAAKHNQRGGAAKKGGPMSVMAFPTLAPPPWSLSLRRLRPIFFYLAPSLARLC